MKRIVIGTLLCTFHFVMPWHYLSFDEAMQKHDYLRAIGQTQKIVGIDGQELYDFCKNLYDHNNLSALEVRPARIPKMIYQIWLGSEVPEALIELQQSWVRHHLGEEWGYKLWTDTDVAQLKLYNQQYYDASDNYGVKADILRYEIIYRFGGIYADMDEECLQSLDELLVYDFFVGLQPLDTFFVQLGAAMFGAVPGHPILKHCIETISDDWHEKGAPKKTGPVHFTKSFYAMAGKDGMKDIALPAYYFYPFSSSGGYIKKQEWTAGGAYAFHWWAKTWMPKKYRYEKFKDINNDYSVESWND